MRYAIGVLFFVNIGLIVYFVFTFERLFLIMKSNTLTELLNYKQQSKLPPKVEEDDFHI